MFTLYVPNYGMQVIECVNAGSSIITKVPLWWRRVGMGKAMYEWGQVVYGKSLYLTLNFAVNLNLKTYSLLKTNKQNNLITVLFFLIPTYLIKSMFYAHFCLQWFYVIKSRTGRQECVQIPSRPSKLPNTVLIFLSKSWLTAFSNRWELRWGKGHRLCLMICSKTIKQCGKLHMWF